MKFKKEIALTEGHLSAALCKKVRNGDIGVLIIREANEDIENISKLKLLPQDLYGSCLLYTSPSPRDRTRSRMPSSA